MFTEKSLSLRVVIDLILSYIGRFNAMNPLRLDGISFFSVIVFGIVAGPFGAIAAAAADLSSELAVAVGDPHD